MALVGCMWHSMLAPSVGACMPATRCVTLGGGDMFAVAQIARPWWRSVRRRAEANGNSQLMDTGLAKLAASWPTATTLDLFGYTKITGKGLASLAPGCTSVIDVDISRYYQITETALTTLASNYPSIDIRKSTNHEYSMASRTFFNIVINFLGFMKTILS